MKWYQRLSTLLLTLALANQTWAQQKSIGVEDTKAELSQEYAGKKFIILERPITSQKTRWFGLELDRRVAREREDLASIANWPNYDKFAGKIITGKGLTTNSSGQAVLTFHEPVNDVLLYARDWAESVQGIAHVSDLETAKARWLNQTVYCQGRFISTYDATKGVYGKTPNTYRTPLKVIDVWWAVLDTGFESPIWLIVETPQGKKGYIGIRASWTNIPKQNRKGNPWETTLFAKNPQELYNWGEEIWSKIDAEKISPGMTEEQVQMSWGSPDQKLQQTTAGKTHITWAYGASMVIFENDKVIHISGPKR
jgi:hypothetical protein